jgi:hypothetical protein
MINLQRFKLGQIEELPPCDGTRWKTRLYDGRNRLCDLTRQPFEGLVISDVRVPHAQFIKTLDSIKSQLEDETGFDPDYALELVLATMLPGESLADGLTRHYELYQEELEEELEEAEERKHNESACCV